MHPEIEYALGMLWMLSLLGLFLVACYGFRWVLRKVDKRWLEDE